MMKAVCLIAILFAAAIAPGHASAQESKPENLHHFKQGNAYYRAGLYAQAVTEYLAAYKQTGETALLFNIAQAYRLKGDRLNARDYYHRFLVARPEGKGSDMARQYVAQLSAEIRVDDANKERMAVENAARSKRTEEMARSQISPVANPVVPTRPSGPVDRPSSGRGLRIAGIASGVAGLGLIGVGIWKGLSAKDSVGALAPNRMWTDSNLMALPGAVSQGEDSARLGYILMGAGGALLITGGLLYFYFGREEPVQITPVLGPQTAGVGASTRF